MLTAPVFHILLALADRDRHGYGILKEVEARSGGEVVLSTGTLYTAIKRLLGDGWIAEVDAPKGTDARRRYYRLTGAGRQSLRAEARRLTALVRAAQAKRIVPVEAAP
jgi:DNA-binding PadR family transcriptional regulator